MSASAAAADDIDFVLTRRFKAPRELMFRVWTDPKHLQQWMSPKGFSVLAADMDLRPGGHYHYGMQAPDGSKMWGQWVFREIDPPRRLVMLSTFSDAERGLTRHPYAPDWPLHTLSTISFDEDAEGWTTLTLRWSPYEATEAERAAFAAAKPSMQQGWGGTMEQLEAHLAESQAEANEIVLTRLINAPRERVFAAWTDPQAIVQWWGPNGFTTTTHGAMDVRPGGVWRFVMHGPDGRDYPNKIVYDEVVPPARLVYRHTDDDGEEGIRFEQRVSFEDRDGRTLVTMRLHFASAELRERVVQQFGAIEGGRQTLGRLAEFVGG
jgi:uncharacterized protein YndB with AHSA1/START domain